MSQRNVEQVIGRLVTDEGYRRRFGADPRGELERLLDEGVALNPCELRALAEIDLARVARFAETLHPCIQKVELSGAERCDVENDGPDSTNHRTDAGGAESPSPESPSPESPSPESRTPEAQLLEDRPPGDTP